MKPKKKIFVVSRDDNLKQPGVAESETIASLYSEIKPLCYVGMVLGTFPFFPRIKSSSSVLTTSAPLWLYSLSVYSALCYVSIRVSPNLDILNVRGVPLEDALANILQFVHRIYFFAVVPISWYNSFCIRQHFNMWLPFLSKYYTLTGEVLILNLRYIRNIFFTMAAAGMLVYYAVSLQFSSKNNIWETFCCSYGDTLVISNASFYIFTCFACKRCFQHLRNYARKQILAPFSVRPENIGKFRDMYSHVHLLLQSFGEESALLFIFVLLLMSSMFVLSVFSAVMAILQQVDPQKYLIFIIDAIGTLVGVILCCFCGQMIFEEVSTILLLKLTIALEFEADNYVLYFSSKAFREFWF